MTATHPTTTTPAANRDAYRRALALAQDLSMAVYAIARAEGWSSPFNTYPTTLYGVPYALECVIDHCVARLDGAPLVASVAPQGEHQEGQGHP